MANEIRDFTALLRARNTLIWIASPEEQRIERFLIEAVATYKYEIRFWDCAEGVTNALREPAFQGSDKLIVPDAALRALRDRPERSVWVFRDFVDPWLNAPTTRRLVKSLARTFATASAKEARTIVILGAQATIPADLADAARLIEWGIPDREEIGRVLDSVFQQREDNKNPLVNGERDAVIEAAVGLSIGQAESCIARSIVTQKGKVVPSVVAEEKKRVVSGQGVEWFDPDPRGLDAIGGLENLKTWLRTRKSAFSKRAREFGLPAPRGILTVGISGTGKSLTAKATATAFEVPLIRLDLGAAQSMYVGQSQQNLRKALRVIDAVGRCVVWLDEIEKSLAGAINGAADGGVASDQLGTLLSWMQEKKGESFIFATANDVSKLPPEFLRKGRFDEIFWLDLPTEKEREAILAVTLRQYRRDPGEIVLSDVAKASKNFTGSEIAAIVPDALFEAFGDGERSLTTADLVLAAGRVTPLAKTAAEKIDAMRKWADGRARSASLVEQPKSALPTEGRALDFDTN